MRRSLFLIPGLLLTATLFTAMTPSPPPPGWIPPPELQSKPVLAGKVDSLVAVWVDGREGDASRLYWTRWPGTLPDTAAARVTAAAGAEIDPALGADDWALVVWQDVSSGARSLWGRRLPEGGPPAPGGATLLAPGPAPCRRPAVAVRGDTALVVWEDERDAPGTLYSATWLRDGGPVNPGGTALPGATGPRFRPRVAAGPLGFVAVWGEDGGPVAGQVFSGDGVSLGAPFDISSGTGFEPDIAAGPDGYLVVWRTPDGVDGDLAARFLGPDGVPTAPAWDLGIGAGLEFAARVARADSGWYLVWNRQSAAGRSLEWGVLGETGVWSSAPEELASSADFTADPAVLGLGAAAAVAWRVPQPGDDDDLVLAWVTEAGGLLGAGPLTLVPDPVLGVPGPGPTPNLTASPNPFRGVVHIGGVSGVVEVFDVAGRRVRILAGEAEPTSWDGRDDGGRDLPPGVYFLRGTGGSEARRVVKLP